MSFAQLLASVPSSLASGQILRAQVPEEWGQGRSTFGGAITGLGLAAMQAVLVGDRSEPERRCRSVLVSFVGPVAAGEIELSASVLRQGRSATHLSASVVQEQGLRCSIMASFARPRASAIEVAGAQRPALAEPEDSLALPFVPGLVPSFTRYFDMRWASGGLPGSGLEESGFCGWIRLRERVAGPLGPAWIAALVDAWPAPVMQMLGKPVAASSLSWALELVDEDPEAASDEFWAFAVETERASGGWVHTRGRLWSPKGVLVAISTQTVALFA